MEYILKLIMTSVLVVAISEIAKRSSVFASIIAALPLTSILAMIWLYLDTGSSEKIINLSYGIFWLVIPSLLFFILLPLSLKYGISFWISILFAGIVTTVIYTAFVYLGIKLGFMQ